ncbi:hypothetical protein N7448_003024 [Penicillium atrosanguineum]|nr:hypothetical protein N7526_008828 [Penicillium atrosanguineum]KAJ5139616.1 hypothetical protein N7448_003024 [Penicillium atrosanguineum]
MTSKDSEASVAVNIEELRSSKDAIIMWSMSIQAQIADFSKAYVEHVNNIINGTSAAIDLPIVPAGLSHFDFVPRASSVGAKSEAGGRKKRKRAPVDPNAPKRPLTPYFLYMQNNRPKIAEDLGSEAKPKVIADEGTRRWQEMDLKEKEIWKSIYGENYERYKIAKAAYDESKKNPTEDTDPAASQLQQDIAGAETQASDSSDDEDEESSSESPSPKPVKEKTPPRSTNKRRRSDAKAIKEVAKEPIPAVTPAKKGRGKAAEPTPLKEKLPEKRSRTKKRKSEV